MWVIQNRMSERARGAAAALFRLQAELRQGAYFRHPEDRVYENGLPVYPRFICVVEKAEDFHRFRQRAKNLEVVLEQEQRPTRWVPRFYDEVWEQVTYSVTTAYSSQLLHSGKPSGDVRAGRIRFEEWREQQESILAQIAALRTLPLEYQHQFSEFVYRKQRFMAVDLQLSLQDPETPISIRRESGRDYNLFVRAVGEAKNRKLGLGAVVVRGLEGPVSPTRDHHTRSDQLQGVRVLETAFCRVGNPQ